MAAMRCDISLRVFSKVVRSPDERFRTFSENFQRLPKSSEKIRMLRSNTNKFDKSHFKNCITSVDKNDILTCGVLFLSICHH